MRSAFYSDPAYREKQSSTTKRLWKEGKYTLLIKPLEIRSCKNTECRTSFKIKSYNPKLFCSRTCATIINNSKRIRGYKPTCLSCSNLVRRNNYKFCSNKCQQGYNFQQYIIRWRDGLEDGNRGKISIVISKHIRRFLMEKYGSKCSLCGWDQKHPNTGSIPLEVDHIDGNSDNNKEENLRLLCPNCHSLTPSFRNLNKGRGRSWRLKYLKMSS